MKRDMDLVRKILLACEAAKSGDAPYPLVVDGFDEQSIGFHVLLMIEAGLLLGADNTAIGDDSPTAIATRMTWSGYEFLDATADPGAWERTKSAAVKAGGWSFEILKAIAVASAVSVGKKVLGAP
jgi:hypothetical protein